MTDVTIFVASPRDVAEERASVRVVAEQLNRYLGKAHGARFVVRAYETDARWRIDEDGAQKLINKDMPVESHNIAIGIFWKRFGTPVPELDNMTGTEYEVRAARKSAKTEVWVAFRDGFGLDDDFEQVRKVVAFRKELPGLPVSYKDAAEFKDKLREYLSQYLESRFPGGPRGDAREYVESVRRESASIEVQQLTMGDTKAWVLPIEEYFIPLSSASRPLAEEAESARCVLIVGDPGSGKSTFLKWLANRMCREHQEAHGGPLPVWMSVAALANHMAAPHAAGKPAEQHSPEWILHFLAAQCKEKNRELDTEFLRREMREGNVRLLLDGLDETPDDRSREGVVKVVRAASEVYGKCRFVVTSRPEGKLDIAGFEEHRIADLSPAQVSWFVEKLAGKLYAADAEKAAAFRSELERANTSRAIRRLARNPVMLTALAVLQHNNVRLPERRVDLYGSVIGWLAKQRADAALEEKRLLWFRELALAMQGAEGGRKKRAALTWAAEQVVKKFGGDREAAEKFLREQQVSSGIIVSRGNELEFWHLTFQEYLAAREIAGKSDEAQRELLIQSGVVWKAEWREVALLYAGLLRNQGNEKVDGLMRVLLDGLGPAPKLAERARVVGLIGAMLRDLDGYSLADARYAESQRLVMDIFDKEKSKGVRFADRLAAAEALGRVQPKWVTIPETSGFWMGAQKKDRNGRNYDPEAVSDETVREVNLPAFLIAKYPVTVGEYEEFVEDGGYSNPEYWAAGGFRKHDAPDGWLDQIDFQRRPVVGVSWHEAMAYAKWAGARLPSEEQWERAARGMNGRKYPWGDGINPELANYENKVGRPTPVGLYPNGASEEGVLDLAGNVWEWTTSPHEGLAGWYVCRGGSWVYESRIARSAYRYYVRAGVRSDYLGFRLVQGIP